MLFRFVGKDGSLGLKKNFTYEVIAHIGDNDVVARIWRPRFGMWITCPYSSLSLFLQNWKEVK